MTNMIEYLAEVVCRGVIAGVAVGTPEQEVRAALGPGGAETRQKGSVFVDYGLVEVVLSAGHCQSIMLQVHRFAFDDDRRAPGVLAPHFPPPPWVVPFQDLRAAIELRSANGVEDHRHHPGSRTYRVVDSDALINVLDGEQVVIGGTHPVAAGDVWSIELLSRP
ncbi:hypothetical protein UO65_3595 [Actinokineospora spheciospongiae]|uniref:Uncharacterized protein n=1 Tax=Actinokineospora spheciospongiae TaxID=909613 RepID=W7J4U1_9PSEU|nr:hypothetical protein [Actinokineospora spheciospongiae]EWC61114.1 hypothetical protein UO65_3595 [Actinokineospora spheciospongiae]